jgi:hypothetical protein
MTSIQADMSRAAAKTTAGSQAEIQRLLRAEIDSLRQTLDQSLGQISSLTKQLETLPAAPAQDLSGRIAALETRHALEIVLLHTLYRSWQNGPAAGVPGFEQQIALISETELFDESWYLTTYGDVAGSGLSPREHYVRSGAYEGRNPGPHFDTMGYYLANPDVAHASWPALVHYVGFGRAEGRPLR